MPPVEPAIAAHAVSHRFGYRRVLEEVTMDASPGDVLLLVGHNGAGKTTLLRILAGLTRPTSGTVSRRGAVGLVAHESMLYDDLTALENLRFFARLTGDIAEDRPLALIEHLGLGRWARERVRTFSRGMVQRLAICRALLAEPALLLLDEPLSGLDDQGAAAVHDVLATQRAQGRALIAVTHNLSELADLATRVAYLAGGRLRAVEPVPGDGPAILDRYHQLAASG